MNLYRKVIRDGIEININTISLLGDGSSSFVGKMTVKDDLQVDYNMVCNGTSTFNGKMTIDDELQVNNGIACIGLETETLDVSGNINFINVLNWLHMPLWILPFRTFWLAVKSDCKWLQSAATWSKWLHSDLQKWLQGDCKVTESDKVTAKVPESDCKVTAKSEWKVTESDWKKCQKWLKVTEWNWKK